MLFDDSYNSIASVAEGIFKDKGSKFIAYAYPVQEEKQIQSIIQDLRKEHPGSRHVCYAYRLGASKLIYRMNDDGEPSGTAGRPIYNQIQSMDLTNVLLAVVRYFGGTLLGVSGLINAYKHAAADALSNSKLITCYVKEMYFLEYGEIDISKVMRLMKELDCVVIEKGYSEQHEIRFMIRKNFSMKLELALKQLLTCRLTYLNTIE